MLFNHNHRSKINKRLDEFKINNELNRVKKELDQVKKQLNSSEQKNTELTQKINILVENNKEKKVITIAENTKEIVIAEKDEVVVEKKDEVVVEKKDEVVVEKKEEVVAEKKDEVVEEKKVAEKKDEVVVEKKDEVVAEKKDEGENKEVVEVIKVDGEDLKIGKIRVKKDEDEEEVVEKNEKLINIFAKTTEEVGEQRICGVPQVECIYCINLANCKERREHMKKQFRKNHFEASFTQAIHPRHPEHRRRYNNARWVDPGWTMSRCYCIHRCEHNARKLRPTEVSISLSHFQIYQKISRKKQKWALVCEDDLVFCKNFCDIINQVVPSKIWKHQLVSEFERDETGVDRYVGGYQEVDDDNEEEERPIILFLGGASDNPKLKITDPDCFEFVRLQKGNYSNYCYLINLAAARFLVRKFFPINRPEDSFKRYWISKGKIDCYKVSPSLIGELSAGTNMPAVYNRWSLSKAPPMKKSLPDKEYQKVKEAENRQKGKSRRLITYNKTRKTKIVKGKK